MNGKMTGRQKLVFLCVASAIGVSVELGARWLNSTPAPEAVFCGVMVMLIADAFLGCWCVAHRLGNPWFGMCLIHVPLARAVVGELPLPWSPFALAIVCLGATLVWFDELQGLSRRRV